MGPSQLVVEVKSEQTTTITTNKGNIIHKQQVALDLGQAFPLPFQLSVRPDQVYKPGKYLLDLSAIRTNRFGSLEFDMYLNLLPQREVKAA